MREWWSREPTVPRSSSTFLHTVGRQPCWATEEVKRGACVEEALARREACVEEAWGRQWVSEEATELTGQALEVEKIR